MSAPPRHVCNGCDCEPEPEPIRTREELLEDARRLDALAETCHPVFAETYRNDARAAREEAATMVERG